MENNTLSLATAFIRRHEQELRGRVSTQAERKEFSAVKELVKQAKKEKGNE